MNTKQLEQYKELLRTLSIENVDLPYFASEDHESSQDLYDSIEEGNGFYVEIIYYTNAMEYLSNYDSSLRKSLEIASEMGYEVKNLSSEILASLLASQNARNEWNEIEGKVQEFFDSLEEEETNTNEQL